MGHRLKHRHELKQEHSEGGTKQNGKNAIIANAESANGNQQ